METQDARSEAFLNGVGVIGSSLLTGLEAMETVSRRLHPPQTRALRFAVAPVLDRLDERLEAFRQLDAPAGLAELGDELVRASTLALDALHLFCDSGPPGEAIARVLGAMRAHCRAQEVLYPLHRALPPVSRFFVEAAYRADIAALAPEPRPEIRVGLFRSRGEPDARGGFALYVPETYDGARPWPLVVALHGGSGNGPDFLWTWLREARGRRFLLLAPTSVGSTWALNGPDVDAASLRSMVDYVGENWSLDRSRILLTGLSDGATYTLLCGLQPDTPFTALAPVSGVLHPVNFANGNMGRARGRRIYLVHGALDWMFPIQVARMASEELTKAGAELCFREIDDLSHAYPREENDRILSWFDAGLSLPKSSGVSD